MYMDKGLIFSENQPLAAGVSTNILDFGAKGDGYPNAFLAVNLEKGLTSAQNLTVEVQTSASESFAPFELAATFVAKKGVTGAVRQHLPMGLNRFVRLNYSVSGSPSGKLTAVVAQDVEIGR